MATENKSMASLLVSTCDFFMMEVGMPNTALQELRNRASATPTNKLESFESVKYFKSVAADIYVLEENMKKQVIIKPQIPDLNKPAPENEGTSELVIAQDHAKVVEAEAEATTTAAKRKITEVSTSGVKRFKGTAESASPTNNDKGKDIIEIEESEDEE